MLNESYSQAVDKVSEKEAKLFLYGVFPIFIVSHDTHTKKTNHETDSSSAAGVLRWGKKDVENRPTPPRQSKYCCECKYFKIIFSGDADQTICVLAMISQTCLC